MQLGEVPDDDAEHSVQHIRQAMQRVRDPLYRFLITSLIDAVTLQVAAVEHAVESDGANLAAPVKHSDRQ